MKMPDILNICEGGEPRVTGRIFDDLCFDNIRRAVFSDRAELWDIFREVLTHISPDAAAVRERQAVFADLASHPHLCDEIISLCTRAGEHKSTAKIRVYKAVSPKQRLKEYLSETVPLLGILDEFKVLMKRYNFNSKTLRDYHIGSPAGLIAEIEKAGKIIDTKNKDDEVDCMKIDLAFGGGYKLRSAVFTDAERVTVEPYYDRREKKTVLLDENFFTFSGSSMAQFIADDIKKAALQNIGSVISQIGSGVLAYFRCLYRAACFYKAALMLRDWFDKNGLAYCMPVIADGCEAGIEARGIYDPGLAAILGKMPEANDISCREGRIIIVTGLNRGGKTTFLRSVGAAQLLAQSGLFVPASEYRCGCFSGILSHFPAEEDKNLDYGMLAEELTRLRSDFPLLAGGGLALLNESFATTTVREGAEIASDILKAAAQSGSVVIFVTHLYESTARFEELNLQLPRGSRAVSLVTENPGDGKRTYRIMRGEPLGDIKVVDMF